MKKLIVLLSTLFLFGAVGPTNYGSPAYTAISAAALNAASNSFEVENIQTNGRFGLMVLYITVVDADNSCTGITMTCTGSPDDNTTDFPLQELTIAAGAATSYGASWTKDPSATASPKRWLWRVDVEGIEDVECTFTDVGGVAADNITVVRQFATKG